MKNSQNNFHRNTKDWYFGKDPLSLVSNEIIDFISQRSGKKIFDFGCGLGGYSLRLGKLGFDCTAADINPAYLEKAKALGLNTYLAKGNKIDFPDNYFDTAILIEVLEHVEDPASILKEIKRVVKDNVLITVPNHTTLDQLMTARIAYDHLLDLDHKQFFSVPQLKALLEKEFPAVQIFEKEPVDLKVIYAVAPRILALLLDLFYQSRILKEKFFYRIYAEAKKK